ncbi:23S rRNA (guanosine(2251)-2'-O)-methyltransferase RlmB [Pseudokineococcus marinus]|uniref:23S rRNA (Guanosine(2251)-2'-O)-methyltransferase RlmB n=1 Tax=Pseudokineococcus marinus TaxID=351215 RepID=A0A849BI60_9ACTN|nr:23S rRNA (guanosine(2251)-2'-O)-methyltransferase RlmB [Pseudokineococcus marinus]NNH22860.1 23S rRNA (guanosine(2251)-2'-O)-methyltransferase RlmB [Pseudokineococcus marinus]
MAGNSQRRGAVRRAGSKKGAVVGSGGRGRKALEGRGPTPKAEDRVYHVAHKRAQAAAGRGGAAGRQAGQSRRRGGAGSTEVVAGRNSVVEALRAGIPATALYVAARTESDDRTREAIKTAADRGVPLLEASRTDLDRLTDGAVHQGLALQVPPYQYADVDDLLEAAAGSERPALVVALDGITDPRNLGAVLRSTAAFGGHGVLLPERRSAGVTASAWKTSAGAAARVPVARVGNLVRALEQLKAAGLFVVGLDAEGDVVLPELELATGPVVLVVGSEGKGLGRLVRETCDQVVSIPMGAETESLNAGVAAGVALYEVARRRG